MSLKSLLIITDVKLHIEADFELSGLKKKAYL